MPLAMKEVLVMKLGTRREDAVKYQAVKTPILMGECCKNLVQMQWKAGWLARLLQGLEGVSADAHFWLSGARAPYIENTLEIYKKIVS
jgi:hypothetical protein